MDAKEWKRAAAESKPEERTSESKPPIDPAELQRLREKDERTAKEADEARKTVDRLKRTHAPHEVIGPAIDAAHAKDAAHERASHSYMCAEDFGGQVFIYRERPREPAHIFCPTPLSKRDIGLALGLADDKRIAEAVNILIRTEGIVLRPHGRKKNSVALDTLPKHLRPRFAEHMQKFYHLNCGEWFDIIA